MPTSSIPDWKSIVTNACEKYEIDLMDPECGKNAAFSRSGASLWLRKGQANIRGPSDGMQFRTQDIEPLLEQALKLLEQAQQDLMYAQAYAEKWATLRCDLIQSLTLDQILKEEEENGKYQYAAIVSAANLSANQKTIDYLAGAQQSLTELQNRTGGGTADGAASRELTWKLAYLRSSENDHSKVEPTLPGPFQDEMAVSPHNVIDVERSLLLRQIDYESVNARLAADGAVATTNAELERARSLASGLKSQSEWDEKNVNFQTYRAERVRQVLRFKVALTQGGDFLDFNARQNECKSRYQTQFAEAYSRLIAIHIGMSEIYNAAPAGQLPARSDEDGCFDAVLRWARNTSSWLAAFTRRTSNYVLPISVKEAVGPEDWESGKALGSWTFDLTPGKFGKNESCIRVRGLSAWIPTGNQLYILNVQLPSGPIGTLRRTEGQSDWKTSAQSARTCRIGRVVSADRRLPTEVVGVVSLYNLSPVGSWTVTAASVPATSMLWPEDFILDLYVSVLSG